MGNEATGSPHDPDGVTVAVPTSVLLGCATAAGTLVSSRAQNQMRMPSCAERSITYQPPLLALNGEPNVPVPNVISQPRLPPVVARQSLEDMWLAVECQEARKK